MGGSLAWRFPLAFQIIFAAIVCVLLLDLPESPRWLFKSDRQEEAIEVLCRVFDKAIDSEFIVTERDAITQALELETAEEGSSWLSLFRNDAVKTRRRVILAYIVMVSKLITGSHMEIYGLIWHQDHGPSYRYQSGCVLRTM